MPVIRAEIGIKIKVVEEIDCPNEKILIIIRRRAHLATRKIAANKTEVLILLKSKNPLH